MQERHHIITTNFDGVELIQAPNIKLQFKHNQFTKSDSPKDGSCDKHGHARLTFSSLLRK